MIYLSLMGTNSIELLLKITAQESFLNRVIQWDFLQPINQSLPLNLKPHFWENYWHTIYVPHGPISYWHWSVWLKFHDIIDVYHYNFRKSSPCKLNPVYPLRCNTYTLCFTIGERMWEMSVRRLLLSESSNVILRTFLQSSILSCCRCRVYWK